MLLRLREVVEFVLQDLWLLPSRHGEDGGVDQGVESEHWIAGE